MDADQNQPVDLLVVGGGINGAGIARDAAGRGLSVILCERDDLAGGTSAASSKLIHGGLRYLEHFEFGLVRKALKEREVLLRAAPHIVRPLDFVLPHAPHLRPAWMIRLGLFLYDHIGGRETLPASKGLNLTKSPTGAVLKGAYRRGFQYADCWVDDARLVVLNAMDAARHGAKILTRTELITAERSDGVWQARLRDMSGRGEWNVKARALVNAAGPWAGEVIAGPLGQGGEDTLRLVKGSHIVVPRLHDADCAYILQNPDGRVVFVIPYEQDFSLIGTTDVELDDMPDAPQITPEETDYLCESVNRYFSKALQPDAVVWSFSGVRPLFDEAEGSASEASRDFVLDMDAPDGEAPLLSVLGGKITTFRVLAEQAVNDLASRRAEGPLDPWTEDAPLPGGDMEGADFNTFLTHFRALYPWLPVDLASRLARSYGTMAHDIIGDSSGIAGLGDEIAPGFFEAELDHLCRREWAETVEDILWRRSKLGLHLTPADQQRLAGYVAVRSAANIDE